MLRRLTHSTAATLVWAWLLWSGGGLAQAQSLADLVESARSGGSAVFGALEFRSESLQALPQWTRVLREIRAERPALDGCTADASRCTTPALKAWRQVITGARGLDRRRQLQVVNEFFNRWPYKEDREIYGASEYWASPLKFMARSGDCEDYSIAKYFALRALGFGKDELRIVAVWDNIRSIGHAVLAVYDDSDILVLDSLSHFIVSDTRYKHYIPQYSVNETTRWAHVATPERN